MHAKRPCHQQLEIPNDQESAAAVLFSTKSYRRILANWASDLLQSRVEERINLPLMPLLPSVCDFNVAA